MGIGERPEEIGLSAIVFAALFAVMSAITAGVAAEAGALPLVGLFGAFSLLFVVMFALAIAQTLHAGGQL